MNYTALTSLPGRVVRIFAGRVTKPAQRQRARSPPPFYRHFRIARVSPDSSVASDSESEDDDDELEDGASAHNAPPIDNGAITKPRDEAIAKVDAPTNGDANAAQYKDEDMDDEIQGPADADLGKGLNAGEAEDDDSELAEEPSHEVPDISRLDEDASDFEYFGDEEDANAANYITAFNTGWTVAAKHVDQYAADKADIDGVDSWNTELLVLHKLLGLRGLFPLMPRSWAADLIDHPEMDDLFPAEGDGRPVLFDAARSQSRATRALRDLFEIHSRVCALRQTGRSDKIATVIAKVLRQYNRWAEMDIELHKGVNYASSVVFTTIDEMLVEEPGQERDNFEGHALRFFRRRARSYRRHYRAIGEKNYPRMMIGFVVVQHLVMLLALDTRNPDAKPELFGRLDMSASDSWLDSGLACAIPVQFARRAMVDVMNRLPRKEKYAREEDDTDDL